MHIKWDENGIRWFLDAGEYTGFHKMLAQKIIPYLLPGDTLCDAGCGLGRLDLELTEYVQSIRSIDINDDAISVLQKDIVNLGKQNIRAEVCDASALDETYDVMLLSFFGQSNMLDFLKNCRRRLIRVVSMENNSTLYPSRHRNYTRDTVASVQEELDAQGIKYSLELSALEFGQPLRTWQDAEQYILRNAPEAPDDEVNDFLKEHLQNTGRDDFPYFLPNYKEFGIFIIDKEDISK